MGHTAHNPVLWHRPACSPGVGPGCPEEQERDGAALLAQGRHGAHAEPPPAVQGARAAAQRAQD